MRSLILFLTLMTITACGGAYPSDQEMEKKLRTHSANFSRLVEMFQQDARLFRVDRGFAYISHDTKANLPDERMDEYRRLLKELDLIQIHRYENVEEIYLKAWRRGRFIIGGSNKHYVYAKTSPSPVVNSLDMLENSGQDAHAYKKVADDWYLYLDVW